MARAWHRLRLGGRRASFRSDPNPHPGLSQTPWRVLCAWVGRRAVGPCPSRRLRGIGSLRGGDRLVYRALGGRLLSVVRARLEKDLGVFL